MPEETGPQKNIVTILAVVVIVAIAIAIIKKKKRSGGAIEVEEGDVVLIET